ncbi:MAG TPA: hypothetical protein VH700_02460 [Gemmatimonadales bacterium]|jgi:hypothetical protein|nr:hypothetical protein [Gemmatimonadales bacterium]
MTTTLTARHLGSSVGAVLANVHESWIRQVTSFLTPATDPRSDFWSRWGAARFLGDQFGDRFRLECAFADALESLIPPHTAARLAATREDIERTRDELAEAGRHRDAAELTATLARRLVEEVARWCVELEQAGERLLPAQLPLAARRLLTRLRLAHAYGR